MKDLSIVTFSWVRSRLAVPSLGGIFEEHSGVAIKGASYQGHHRTRGKSDIMDMQVGLSVA